MELYKKILSQLISFKSISTDTKYKKEINDTALAIQKLFEDYNFKTQYISGYGNPLVFAEYEVNKDAQTALIYGHYDVQPASLNEGWSFNPFELTEENERLYGRGVVDNKGQFVVHMATIFELIEKDELKYNIKFLLEGEEEIGSQNFEKFILENKNLLQADFAMISDGETVNDMPSIDSSFRGIVNFSLRVKTAQKELHSGLFGGTVPNAALEASVILSNLFDEDGVFKDKRFYEGLAEPSQAIIENNKKVIELSGDPLEISTTKRLQGLMDMDRITRNSMYPSFEVTTLKSGYMDQGYKNAIPNTALVKVNVRLAPDQNPNQIFENLKEIINEATPSHVEIEYEMEQGSKGVILDVDKDNYLELANLLKEVYGCEVVFNYNGAVIPLVIMLNDILKMPVYSVGLANEDCNMHAHDENFKIDLIKKGLEFSKRFFSLA